jgi:hypothetical protein
VPKLLQHTARDWAEGLGTGGGSGRLCFRMSEGKWRHNPLFM